MCRVWGDGRGGSCGCCIRRYRIEKGLFRLVVFGSWKRKLEVFLGEEVCCWGLEVDFIRLDRGGEGVRRI